MSKKISQEKKEWGKFISSRVSQLEEALYTEEMKDDDYKELSDTLDSLYKKINAFLPQDLQHALQDYSETRTVIECKYADASYALGMKDAFMLMKKFIL